MNNLFFISGPHGGGKTTLLDKLSRADSRILIPELETTTPKFDTEPLERQILKICQRPIENYEALLIAEKNEDKIVIGNRCIYDVDAYTDVYFKVGWFKENEYVDLKSLIKFSHIAFPERLRNPKAILLNPTFEVVKERLENRWLKKEKKWNEDNLDYLKAACEAYEVYRENPNILYLENNEDVDKVLKWVYNNSSAPLFTNKTFKYNLNNDYIMLTNIIRREPDARRIFGKKEIVIILKQMEGMFLTQSEKNRLSRDIRPKLRFIKKIAKAQDEFELKRNEEINKLIDKAVKLILQDKLKDRIKAILLFGSRVNGIVTPRSDIDICVVFTEINLTEAVKFRIRILGNFSEKVDVQVFNVLPQKIKREIARKHRILYRKRNYDNIEFTIQHLKDEDYFIRLKKYFGKNG